LHLVRRPKLQDQINADLVAAWEAGANVESYFVTAEEYNVLLASKTVVFLRSDETCKKPPALGVMKTAIGPVWLLLKGAR
ncbi:MAG TPA: hypothetical protein VFE52_08550, partial [Devosia sp.]|nr:hypothetical protein [Devosia sp.]